MTDPHKSLLPRGTGLAAVKEGIGQWKILSLITLTHSWVSLGVYSLPPLAVFIQLDMALTRAQFGSLMSSWSLGALLASIPAGWIGRWIGSWRTMILGQGLLGACMVLLSQLDSYPLAAGAMLMAGIGYGVVAPSTSQVVREYFSRRSRATVMGFKQMGVPLGSLVAAVVAPSVAEFAGWRYALGLIGGLAATTSLLMARAYRGKGRDKQMPVSPTYRDLRNLFRRDLVLTYLTGMLLAGTQVAIVTYFALFLYESVQLTVVVAGGFVALMQLSAVIGRVGWGVVSDWIFVGRRKNVLGLTAALAAGTALTMGQASSVTPGWLIAILSAALGACIIGWSGVYLALISELATADMTGIATGMSAIFTYVGVIMLPPLFGHLVDKTGAYGVAWMVTAGLIVLSIGLLYGVRETVAGRS